MATALGSVAYAQDPSPVKTTKDIYNETKKAIAFLRDENVVGFIVRINKQPFFITAGQQLPEQEQSFNIELPFKGTVKATENVRTEKGLDLQLLECIPDEGGIEAIPFLEIGDHIELAVGTEVYIIGIPRIARGVLFHKGYISSVEKKDQISRFTIDGTVLEGHCGSPVVAKIKDKLFVIGVVISQLADPDVEGGNANLSTGVGCAIAVGHCYNLFVGKDERMNESLKLLRGDPYEVATGRGKNGIDLKRLTKILGSRGWKNTNEKGKHGFWWVKEGVTGRLEVVNGDPIKEGTARGILKDMCQHEGLSDEEAAEVKRSL